MRWGKKLASYYPPRCPHGMRLANCVSCGTAPDGSDPAPAPKHLGGRTMQILFEAEHELPGGLILEIRLLRSMGDESGVFRK